MLIREETFVLEDAVAGKTWNSPASYDHYEPFFEEQL